MAVRQRASNRGFRAGASLALALAACVEPTGVTARPSLRLALRIPAATSRQMGVVDAVHVSLLRLPATSPFADTTASLSATDDSVALAINVPLEPTGQLIVITVDLISGGTPLYRGVDEVVLLPGQRTAQAPPITWAYIGPGGGIGSIPARVAILPRDVTLLLAGVAQFVATVFDSAGHAVPGVPITWTLSNNSLATISSLGLLTSVGGTGTLRVVATTPTGLADTAQVTIAQVVNQVAKLLTVSGDGQSALLGLELLNPMVVQAVNAAGQPVSGVLVKFAGLATGSLVVPSGVTTGADGLAQTTMILGLVLGQERFTATAGSLADTLSETALSPLSSRARITAPRTRSN